ncbi:hypothetical protein ACT691_01295 [Vibrio metschnikovii]
MGFDVAVRNANDGILLLKPQKVMGEYQYFAAYARSCLHLTVQPPERVSDSRRSATALNPGELNRIGGGPFGGNRPLNGTLVANLPNWC